MESEIETTDFNQKGWIGKIKDWSYENWQTILIILIVLIVGMSAYNYNQQNNSSSENQSPVTIVDNNNTSEDISEGETVEENDKTEENSEEMSEADIENTDQAKAIEEDSRAKDEEPEETTESKDQEENNPVISNSDSSGKNYTVYANQGEGITHLSRRVLNEYLQENEAGFELTREHKIYIEDYLQNRTGSGIIEINHQEIFSINLIEEAISSAKQLTPKSLDNLKKYI